MTVETAKPRGYWSQRGVTYQIHRNHGHPWTGDNRWDGMTVEADTEDALSDFISSAQRRFWAVWIRDNTGNKRAFLYKPHGASAPWQDP
jgi:hypothetical protein